MMETSGRVMSFCVALFLTLTSVSAVQRIHSINDLKKINFGQTVPMHSLVLLHWFANTVEIDNTNVIRLNFDPEHRDYYAHHYGNFEGLLDPLPRGYQYYTVGNLNQDTSTPLPSYVVHPPSGYGGSNRDRIIIRVREQRIDQVYLTQHYPHQNTYDPDQTYQITANLLKQIREFALGGNQQRLFELRNRYGSNADVTQIIRTRGHLASLGLFLFIVIQETNVHQLLFNQQCNRRENRQAYWSDDAASVAYGSYGNRESGNSFNSQSPFGLFCMTCLACIVFMVIMLGFAIFSSQK